MRIIGCHNRCDAGGNRQQSADALHSGPIDWPGMSGFVLSSLVGTFVLLYDFCTLHGILVIRTDGVCRGAVPFWCTTLVRRIHYIGRSAVVR